jgi:hypothetical protein
MEAERKKDQTSKPRTAELVGITSAKKLRRLKVSYPFACFDGRIQHMSTLNHRS